MLTGVSRPFARQQTVRAFFAENPLPRLEVSRCQKNTSQSVIPSKPPDFSGRL
jgi:hypothetical protein